MRELIAEGPYAGWYRWNREPGRGFAGLLGDMYFLPPGEAGAETRLMLETGPQHGNVMGFLHGGLLMAFTDFALFAVLRAEEQDDVQAVTISCSTDFLDAGRVGVPLQASGRLVRGSGRLVFVEGRLWQEERAIARWNGILRRISRSK